MSATPADSLALLARLPSLFPTYSRALCRRRDRLHVVLTRCLAEAEREETMTLVCRPADDHTFDIGFEGTTRVFTLEKDALRAAQAAYSAFASRARDGGVAPVSGLSACNALRASLRRRAAWVNERPAARHSLPPWAQCQ